MYWLKKSGTVILALAASVVLALGVMGAWQWFSTDTAKAEIKTVVADAQQLAAAQSYEKAVALLKRLIAKHAKQPALIAYAEQLRDEYSAKAVEERQRQIWEAHKKASQEALAAVENLTATGTEASLNEALSQATTALTEYGDTTLATNLTSVQKRAQEALAELNRQRETRFQEHYRKALVFYQQSPPDLSNAQLSLQAALKEKSDTTTEHLYDAITTTLTGYRIALSQGKEKLLEGDRRRDKLVVLAAIEQFRKAENLWPTTEVTGLLTRAEALAAQIKDRLAVVDFVVLGNVDAADVGKIVAERLLGRLTTGKYELIERSQLLTLLNEQKFQMIDLVDEQKAEKFGKIAAVRYLVYGSISKVGTSYEISARISDVYSGRIGQKSQVTARNLDSIAGPVQMQQLADDLMSDNTSGLHRAADRVAALRSPRLSALKSLYLEQKLTIEQYQMGERLLQTPEDTLDGYDQKRLADFVALADGNLDPAHLQRALDAIETPKQRTARLAREAADQAEQEKQTRIAALLSNAQANDSKMNGRVALAILDQLLTLAPSHREALALRAKIIGYYAPSKDNPWTNSLGMKFVPVRGTSVLFSVWDTRVRDYQAFISATGRSWEKPNFEQGPTHPAVHVSWEDAKAFCKWLTNKEQGEGRLHSGQTYRLPTDAEWSEAVGLGEEVGRTPAEKDANIKDVYPWGRQWPPPPGSGNYAGEESKAGAVKNRAVISGYNDGYPRTSPVGSFRANQFGLYDMSGNVWQWCEDCYKLSEPSRVLRGGSWANDGADYLLSSYRSYGHPDYRLLTYGFRCVLVVGSSLLR